MRRGRSQVLEKLGIVGVGRMGAGMAMSARRAGFEVLFVRHRSAETAARLSEAGCREMPGLAELVTASDVLLLCLPSSREVGQVLEQVGIGVQPTSGIVLDCSTSLPGETVLWAERLLHAGVRLYDAPLTRTPTEAMAGRLRSITSCAGDDWAEVQPVLMSFCEDVVHVTGIGKAHELKLVNNLLSMGQVCLAVDGLTIAEACSVSASELQAVVAGGAASSAALTGLLQYLGGDSEILNFKIESALKDVRYALSNTALQGRTLGVARAVEETFARAVEEGFGSEPLPALLRRSGVMGLES
jgi:3-hydroxyisobutyrate dehydrogenase-like beta-hydroxyacid dehydrogenase